MTDWTPRLRRRLTELARDKSLSSAEIAESLGVVSASAVRSQLKRLRERPDQIRGRIKVLEAEVDCLRKELADAEAHTRRLTKHN